MDGKSTFLTIIRIILYILFWPIFVLIWIWDKTAWPKIVKWLATTGTVVVFLFFSLIVLGMILSATDTEHKDQTATVVSSNQQKIAQTEEKNLDPVQTDTTQVQDPTKEESLEQVETFKVSRVVDGDTIKLDNGQVLRYIGIDTPETVDPRKPVQCFGKEASDKNRELVEGKDVRLVKDVSETDKYGRILRYVYVGDTFVNDYLVRNGYAHSYSYPPDIKYQDQFKQAEEEARNNKRGLWADNACPPEPFCGDNTCNNGETCSSCSKDCGSCASPPSLPQTTPPSNGSKSSSSGTFTCNCSKTCPQMSSCAEAQYQLNTCGCTRRDADHDGIACDVDCQ